MRSQITTGVSRAAAAAGLAMLVWIAAGVPIEPRALADTWQIDPAHTSVEFGVRHLMISTVRGKFQTVSGTVSSNGRDPNSVNIEVTIGAGSIDTGNGFRDDDLKSPDFLNVEKFPTITFKSRKVEAAGENKWKITGDLTLHGVTREVALDVDGPTSEIKDPTGATRIGASATTRINRKDFGLMYNKVLESGGVLVGDEVPISIEVEATRKAAGSPTGG